MGFITKLAERRKVVNGCLCIGLDPDDSDIRNFLKNEEENGYCNIKSNLKEEGLNCFEKDKKKILQEYGTFDITKEEKFFYFFHHFCFYIINKTKQYALVYKMNLAFYILYGSKGIDVLKNIFLYLQYLNIPTILDIKVNDIGNTLNKYQSFIFDYLQSDCCTVNIYMGSDILKNICFNEITKKYYSVYVLIKTTNPDSHLFQNQLSFQNKKAYIVMAEEAQKISKQLQMEQNDEFIGFVVGANSYEEMILIRKQFPESYILAPGVGIQQANLQKALINGYNKDYEKLLINVGRAITKSSNPEEAAHSFYQMITSVIKSI